MATKELKVNFSGDTTVYRKEVDKAAVATDKFKKDAGSAMSNLAGVFGVNVSAIKGSIDGMSKGFTMMLTSMKASAVGATIWQTAMNVIRIATISTGIGALIVAVGSLVAYFTQTREGANFVKQAMAGLGAAVRVVRDHFSSFGEGIFKLFKGDWAGSAAAFKASVSGIGTEMVENAKAATELEKRTQALNKAERESKVINAEKLALAAELRRDAKDTENFDAAERKKKLQEARTLIIEVNNEEKAIAKGRLEIFQSQIAMRKKSSEDLSKEVELKMTVSEIDRASAMDQKGILREMKGVTKEVNAQAEAYQKLIEEKRKEALGERPKTAYANEVTVTTNVKDGKNELQGVQKYKDQLNSANIATQEAADQIKSQTLDLSATLNNAWGSAADGLGVFIGELMSGKGSVADFGSFVAMQFADLAVTVGKQMIAFGATGIALKMLIKNPWLALGAGIALVALGTAAKSKISASISSGGATSAASSSGGSNDYNYDARQSMGASQMQKVNVTVGGEFKLQNGVLVAAIAQENQRKLLVT